ncbi:hypothetical protein AVEN_92515-1 [Araneus ventricosus]|uniref:Reverse transcriptase Ty1/copia-type domain-containing protein n=1 Tax=Araneus ventricosus TaxID=182803 RepID=A0A4Y2AHN9_ARAVE|nr:hypothetical protein AVEN_92515-1 [Araneus ventricosus]
MHSNTDTDNEDNATLPCSGQSSRTRKAPNYLNDFVMYNAKETGGASGVEECKTPTTVKEALASTESKMWQRAMEEEIENLQNTQTWELFTKPAGVKLITSRWLFRKKKDEAGY